MHAQVDKLRILSLMRTEYDFASRTLALLTPAQMHLPNAHGPWSVKDLVAHLTAWHRRLLNWVSDHSVGKPVYVPEQGYTWADMNRLNDETALRDKARPLDEILREFHTTYVLIERLVVEIPERELLLAPPWENTPLWEIIKNNTWEHYIEHFPRVRSWAAAKR